MPKLHVILPEGPEAVHELTEEIVTIGRLPDNVVQIEDPSVSSHHAQLTLIGSDYHLKDLNSTNGTRVNGKNFVEWQLEDGDEVRFGKVEARYHSEVPASPRPLPATEEPAVAMAAESSHRPADFANASPFKTKKKKRDPAGAAIIAFTLFSMLVFAWAVFNILTLQPRL
jgi:predicted component of type VI protein secretion system